MPQLAVVSSTSSILVVCPRHPYRCARRKQVHVYYASLHINQPGAAEWSIMSARCIILQRILGDCTGDIKDTPRFLGTAERYYMINRQSELELHWAALRDTGRTCTRTHGHWHHDRAVYGPERVQLAVSVADNYKQWHCSCVCNLPLV